MKRRILAILLAAIMVLSAVPFSVFAEEATVVCPGKGEIHTLDNCDSEKFADVAPVCNKPGYSVYTCLNPECGDQFVVITKEASNTPHTLVKATKAATCTEDGIKEDRWQCTACKSYFSDAEGKNETDDYKTDKLVHELGGVSQWETLANDCTTQKCKLCGATQATPADGTTHDGAHDYKVIKFHTPAATCKDTAKADVKCTVCGFEKKNVDVASDVPHDFKDAVTKKDPTCTDKGYKAHKQCKVCNRYFALDGVTELFANPTTDAQKANALYIAARGHEATYLIAEKPATCTTDGSRTYRCGREGCGEFIENEVIPKNPIKGYWIYNKDTNKYVTVDGTANGAKLIVKKTGTNTYEVWYGDKDKDYPDAEDGTLGAKQEFRDANIVLHKFSVETKAATCTEYGYTKKVCLLCGTEETVKADPTYHLKADGKTVNGTKVADSPKAIKPTCVTAGVDIYKCNACSAEVAVKVNAWGHSAEKTVTTANCQSAGVTFTYVTAPANAPAGWTCTCDTYDAVSSKTFYKEDGTTVKATYALWDPATVKAGADGAFVGETFFVKGGLNGITEAAKDANKHVIRTQVVNEPTCTTAGNGFKFCLVKGCTFEPETYTISAKGHKFELTWANGTTAANMTLKNSQQYKTNFGTTVAATCTTNTYFAVKCKNCSAVSAAGEKVSGLSTDLANDKLGHKVVTEEFYVICDGKTLNNGLAATKGYKITYCKNEACNTKTAKDNDKQDCGYVIDRVETTAYAEKLSYTKDEVLNYHPNLFDVYKDGDTDIPSDKKVGDLKYFDEVYKVGSCTEVGYDKYNCPTCTKNILVVQGDTGSHLKPAVDDRNASNYKAQQNATCCVDGKTEWYVCQRCAAEIGGTTITKDCHYVLVIAGKEASCNPDGTITYGYKAIYTCDADNCCNKEKFFEYKKVGTNADGSDKYGYVQLAGITRAMVYVKNGSTWTNTLKNANVLANMALDKVTKTINDNKASNVFAADNVRLGDEINSGKIHNFENKDGKAANCTEDGYSAYQQCKECGYISGKKTIKAPVHDFDDKEPYAVDCLNAGYFIRTCTICDYVEITGYTAPTGHDWQPVAGKQGVKATCEEDGGDYVYCTKCSATDILNRVEMLDHVNKDGVAIGHGDSTTPIICTINFKDDQLECKACGHTVDKTHIEKTTLIAPTCTTAGYTVVICAGCNEVLEEKTEVDTLPALNHKYADGSDAWKLTKTDAATETATGTKYFECQLCKATKTEVIPPVSTIYLDLTYANANGKEGFAEYSLITVNVLLSSKKAAIRTLSYELNYDEKKLEFVSAKFDSTLLKIAEVNDAVVDEATGDRAVKFAGMSPNAVEVGEAAVIATITFRALAAGDAQFNFANAEAYLGTGAKVEVNDVIDNADTKENESIIKIATLMDVYTKDTVPGTVDMQDALAIYDLMTNSEYNVAADLDKDGEITANDLQLFYSIFVGKMEKAALRNYEVN